ncbi:MAG: hypothetical protein ABUT20_21905 [Bacteroidota bacterium]
MRKPAKALVLFTISVLLSNFLPAQNLLPVNGIGNDIKKVIEDYPNHFKNISGEIIVQNPQSTDYQCNFKVNGAEETTITHYSSKNDNVCSWQSLLLTTENFEKAKQKFKALFNQLNNLSVHTSTSSTFHLKGVYKIPDEGKTFTSILYSFVPPDDAIGKLKVELSLQYQLMEWKVRVLVYDKEREDNEKGNAVEELP